MKNKVIIYFILFILITNSMYSRIKIADILKDINNNADFIFPNDNNLKNKFISLDPFEKFLTVYIGSIGNDNIDYAVIDPIEIEVFNMLIINKDFNKTTYIVQKWKAENPEKIENIDNFITFFGLYLENLENKLFYSYLKETYDEEIETEIKNVSLNLFYDLYPDKNKIAKERIILNSVRPIINYYQNATLNKKEKMVKVIKASEHPEKYIELLSELNPNFAQIINNEINK